jgi:hypothetical protein
LVPLEVGAWLMADKLHVQASPAQQRLARRWEIDLIA